MNTDRFRFRALDIEKNMVYGLPFYSHAESSWFITQSNGWIPSYSNPDEGTSTKYIPIDHKTLSQCTGLKDKNGALIYEGDVVEYKFSSLAEKFIQVVEYSIRTMESSDVDWINVGFVLKGKENDGSDWFSTFTPHARYKVIGNIYQNEDLLNDS